MTRPALVSGVLWNFFGHGWALLLSFITTPFVLSRLGDSLFGIYALAGFVLTYFSVLEFGLGAAATKYIAEHSAKDNQRGIVASFWGCALCLGGASLLCVMMLTGLVSSLVAGPLRIAPPLQATASTAIRLAGLLFCFSLGTGLTTGTLRAFGRFSAVNASGVAAVTAQAAVLVGALALGYSLLEGMAGLCAVQAGLLVWQFILCVRVFPPLTRPRTDRRTLGRLIKYGGTLAVAGVTAPILTHVEKIFMTRFTSVGLLTYYAVPFSLVDRLAMIPSSFGSVLFPSYSYFDVSEPKRNRELHHRSTMYILVAYGFFASFLAILGRPFLSAWLGEPFAARSAFVLAVLAAGGLVNALARPAGTILQGIGKPHIPALLSLAETLLYVPLAYALVRAYGMEGAAWAWFVRVAADAVALHVASAAVLGERARAYAFLVWPGSVPIGLCSLAFGLIRFAGLPLASPVGAATLLVTAAGYAFLTWRMILGDGTRETIRSVCWPAGGPV